MVAGVRDVDRDPELVHPLDGAAAELGEPTVTWLLQAAAERVRLAVGDTHLPDAEAVEHVEAVDLVLDRGGGLQAEHQGQAALLVSGQDVGDGARHDDEVLVRQVGQAHAEVVDDVVPLPADLAGDAGRAVHQVVEDRGHARRGQTTEARVLARRPDVLLTYPAHVLREDRRVVVQAR